MKSGEDSILIFSISPKSFPSLTEKEQWFEHLLLVLTVVLLAFVFPLQVLFRSPLPALIPYVMLTLAWGIRVRAQLQRSGGLQERIVNCRPLFSDWVVMAYAGIVLAHMGVNLMIGAVGWTALSANTINFLFPLMFYMYFRLFADVGNVRSIMVGILVGCVVTSAYSVTHGYMKIRNSPVVAEVPEKVARESTLKTRESSVERPTEVSVRPEAQEKTSREPSAFDLAERYQLAAGDYSRLRANEDDDYVKKTMRSGGPRSAGLQESHSVTAAWIALGLFAALGLTPLRLPWLRQVIAIFFILLLLVFQYYTAIFAAMGALMVVLLGSRVGRAYMKMSSRQSARKFCLFVVLLLFLLVVFLNVNDHYLANLKYMAQLQYQLLVGGGESKYFDKIFDKLHGYLTFLFNFPWVGIFGDGLGIYFPYSFSKGGDVGFVESLARLGIPLLVIVLGALVKWVGDFLVNGNPIVLRDGAKSDELPIFALGMIIYVLVNDVHYSIWPAKSILPLLMIAFALCGVSGKNERGCR